MDGLEKKRKIIGAILGISIFVVMLIGGAYAYYTWVSDKLNYTGGSKCFNILYTKGTDIGGNLIPSYDYTGGLSTTIKMNISNSCDITAKGKIYLETSSDTSSNLFRTGLLNYQVVKGSTLVASGNITSSGEIPIDIGDLTKSSTASTSYKLYVWVDYNLIENSDTFSSYSGSIRAEAVQYD